MGKFPITKRNCTPHWKHSPTKCNPRRWNDVRKPSEKEWKATLVLSLPIIEASAKVRTGPLNDAEDDYALDVWAGVLPTQLQRLTPVPDSRLRAGIALPHYLK